MIPALVMLKCPKRTCDFFKWIDEPLRILIDRLSLTLFTRTFFLDFVCDFINFYTSDFLFITTSDLFTQHSVVYRPCLFGAVFPPGPND